jgi:hydroxypyruvate reductase
VKLSADSSTLTVSGQSYALDDYDEIVVVGAGKASAQMAASIYEILGDRITAGHVVTKYDHTNGALTGPISVTEAAHPIPDESGVAGGKQVMAIANAATERTLLFACMSGGGSALLVQPAEGLTLDDMQQANARFMESGADITLVNTIRKHLSAVKGGNLALAAAPVSPAVHSSARHTSRCGSNVCCCRRQWCPWC